MKKKRIENLERDIEELKKKLDEEVTKQKMSSDKLSEELVSWVLCRRGRLISSRRRRDL